MEPKQPAASPPPPPASRRRTRRTRRRRRTRTSPSSPSPGRLPPHRTRSDARPARARGARGSRAALGRAPPLPPVGGVGLPDPRRPPPAGGGRPARSLPSASPAFLRGRGGSASPPSIWMSLSPWFAPFASSAQPCDSSGQGPAMAALQPPPRSRPLSSRFLSCRPTHRCCSPSGSVPADGGWPSVCSSKGVL